MSLETRAAFRPKRFDMISASALALLLAASSTAGQGSTSRPTTTAPAAQSELWTVPPDPTTSAPATPLPGFKSQPLRYNEDYRYLDGPMGSYTPDYVDPIKNIHLGENWRLRLGGEVRLRMEAETNKNFGQYDPTTDTFLIHHYLLHSDFQYRKFFRFFLEGIDAEVTGRDLPMAAGMHNRYDFNQAFLDIRPFGNDTPLTLRVGRQEIIHGRERLVAKSDWSNVSRRFDGARLLYSSKPFDIEFFWTKPIVLSPRPFGNPPRHPVMNEDLDTSLDHFREEQQFYGTHASYKGIPGHSLDAYFYGLNDNGFLQNVNGVRGDLCVYTVGGRLTGTSGNWDYDTESAWQWGVHAGDTVRAWMTDTDAGYTFTSIPWMPRIGMGFEYASGDEDPRDNRVQTFNQLFHSGHAYLGYIDLVGLQNVIAPDISLTLKPLKNVTLRGAYYYFWLADKDDALYAAGGNATRRHPTGDAGREVGDEVDFTVNWQVDPHSTLLLGWSHFWPATFINKTSVFAEDGDLIYVQWQYKF